MLSGACRSRVGVSLQPLFPRLVAGLLLAGLVAGQARGGADVLDRPATISPHATQAAFLAVTRAAGRLVAAGERGIILTSDDQGATWKQAEVPVSVSLTAVQFSTATRGWAVGHSGVVLHTRDGGLTWSKQREGGRQSTPEAQDEPLLDVWFADSDRGFAVGAHGLFLATADGGRTWVDWRDHLPNRERRHLYSIRGAGGHIYLAGEQGALFRSDDGGRSFQPLPTPYPGTWFGVLPRSNGTTLVFGLRGHVYRTTDAGGSWDQIHVPSSTSIVAGLQLRDGALVLASQGGDLLRSGDDGRHFERMPFGPLPPVTALAQAGDGRLVVSGLRGVLRP